MLDSFHMEEEGDEADLVGAMMELRVAGDGEAKRRPNLGFRVSAREQGEKGREKWGSMVCYRRRQGSYRRPGRRRGSRRTRGSIGGDGVDTQLLGRREEEDKTSCTDNPLAFGKSRKLKNRTKNKGILSYLTFVKIANSSFELVGFTWKPQKLWSLKY